MTQLNILLELRRKMKDKKPVFIRQDAHKKDKLKENWRQPKGIHSKMRLKRKGYRKQPSIGYGSPKKVRFLTGKGLREKVVHNISNLEGTKNNETVVISKSVGLRKKIEILKKIKELKLNISNIRDIDGFLKKVEENRKKEAKAKKDEKKKEEPRKPEVEKLEATKEEIKEKEKLGKKKVLERRSAKQIK